MRRQIDIHSVRHLIGRGHVIELLFTTVYADNARSRAALLRSGFSHMPVQALPPHHELLFYCRSAPLLTQADRLKRIAEFSTRAGIGFSFDPHRT